MEMRNCPISGKSIVNKRRVVNQVFYTSFDVDYLFFDANKLSAFISTNLL